MAASRYPRTRNPTIRPYSALVQGPVVRMVSATLSWQEFFTVSKVSVLPLSR